MKKIFLFLIIILLLVGCGKNDKKTIVKDLSNKIRDIKSYNMKATLDIYRNEEKYSYDVDSSFMKDNYYKVELVNKSNNHKQIILKNKEGVFVLTPSLNKSFKFQSDWPNNNSQIYLLQPIISDINNDDDRIIETSENGYIITSKVNYSTERDFSKQKVYVDNEKNLIKVEVLDDSENIKMSLTIIDIDYKVTLDETHFNSNKYISSDTNQSAVTESSTIEEVVYPMYIPTDTYLTAQDVVDTNNGERAILTFNGESAFTIIQENISKDETVNYVYGDPCLILDTVGSVSDSSVSWISNGVEYSVMSDTMDVDELLTVAQSITVKTVGK